MITILRGGSCDSVVRTVPDTRGVSTTVRDELGDNLDELYYLETGFRLVLE